MFCRIIFNTNLLFLTSVAAKKLEEEMEKERKAKEEKGHFKFFKINEKVCTACKGLCSESL